MSAIRAELQVSGSEAVILLQGALDVATRPDTLALVDAALSNVTVSILTLHLNRVDFLDSFGIGTLILIRNQCNDYGAVLRLRAVQPRVREVLTMTGLAQVFGQVQP